VQSINLLKLALDSEILRLRAMLARQSRRAAFGSIALVFALAVVALAEVAGWQGLRLCVEAIPTTLILLGINLAITAVFSLLAVRSSPGHAEQEALRARRQALDAARGSLFITAAVPAATALLGFDRRRGRWRSWLRLFRR
jgi:cobalamin biosynthesis protein CobD/CbiB